MRYDIIFRVKKAFINDSSNLSSNSYKILDSIEEMIRLKYVVGDKRPNPKLRKKLKLKRDQATTTST